MKKIRHYILPFSAAEGTMADLDALLDAADAQDTQTTTTADTGTEMDTGTGTDDSAAQQQQQTNNQQQSRQNFAFGQLRQRATQADSFEALLGKVASAAGIQYTDTADLINKLNDDTIGKLAAQQNVPVELLRKVERLEQDSAILQQTRLKDAATLGFQSVMSTYELSQDELMAFAQELDVDGMNPFTSQVNLMNEYKIRHFEDIMNKRVDKAVQDALTRSNNADTHSTVPNKANGKNDTTGDNITTVAQLTALLDKM